MRTTGLLGDTTARDYAGKLQQFNEFAAPELRRAMANLALEPGSRVLDAGCGTGAALQWLNDIVGPRGRVVGIDLAAAHVAAARTNAPAGALVLQADATHLPFAAGSFDLVWTVNTVNHLRDPLSAVHGLLRLLSPGGRVALGQSSLLPEMFFAWDARLERVTTEAVRRYYRERYGLSERALTDIRAVVGLLRRAGLRRVTVQTHVIERVSPLQAQDEAYLVEAIFRDTWGERLRPYLADDDYAELSALCDPGHASFALRRPDFHYLQTFTLAVGQT